MKKIILISIMLLASVFAVPIVLAGEGINITEFTAQAGPPGSASINGSFLINNLETYDDANYTVDVLMLSLMGTAEKLSNSDSFNPGEGTIIAKETDGFFNYNVGVTGEGWVIAQSSVTGSYYENDTLGFIPASSSWSSKIIVDSTLPEFSSAIFPILLSMILFGIIRRKVE